MRLYYGNHIAEKIEDIHKRRAKKCLSILRAQLARAQERALVALAMQIMEKRGELITED